MNVLLARIYENIKDSEVEVSRHDWGDVEVMFSSERDGEISFVFSIPAAKRLIVKIKEAINAKRK